VKKAKEMLGQLRSSLLPAVILAKINLEKTVEATMAAQLQIASKREAIEVLQENNDQLKESLKVLQQMHTLPLAYLAVLCELQRRSLVQEHLQREVSVLNASLVRFLCHKEEPLRNNFLKELSSLADPALFTSKQL